MNVPATPCSGSPASLTVEGRRLVLTTAGTIAVFDVANPAAPVFLGFDQTSRNTQAHAATGDHAFLVGYHDGLDIHAIADPADGMPAISTYPFADAHNFSGVGVAGTRVYASGYSTDLSVFDVSDPHAPVLVGAAPVDGGASPSFAARHIRVVGDRILMAGGDDDWGAVKIFRDQPAGDPDFLGEFRVIDMSGSRPPGVSKRIESVGNVAFVADSGAGLILLDITDPALPQLIDSDISGTTTDDLALAANDGLLVTSTCTECSIFDLTSPAAPLLRGKVALSELGSACQVRVAASGSTAYVVGDRALVCIDLTNPESPRVIGRFEIGGIRARDVKVAGSIAYVAAEIGLVAMDITNPKTPIVLPGDGGGMYHTLEIDGTRAVARRDSQGAIDIFDLGFDGRTPTHRGFVFVDSISSYDVSGARLYVARPNAGLLTFDISNPANPSIVGDVSGDRWRAAEIDVRGTNAYVRNFEHGFAIFDVSNPNQPGLIGQFSDGGLVTGFVIDGTRAYLTQTTDKPGYNVELVVVDIGDAARPGKLGSVPATIAEGGETDLAAANGFVFGVVPGTDRNSFVFDVTDPTTPVFVAPAIGGWLGRIDYVEAVGNRLFLAHGYLGLRILDASLSPPKLSIERLVPGGPRPLRLTWDAPAGVPFSLESSRDLSNWQPLGRFPDHRLDQALGLMFDPAPHAPAFFRVAGR
jgi:hypothetical protein